MESLRAEAPAAAINPEDVVLVAVAHPDDETVLHSEFIRRSVEAGAEVHIAYATVGKESTINNRFWQPNFVKNGRRWREALKAARSMGVPSANLHNLGLPDGKLEEHLDELSEKLGSLLLAAHVTKAGTSGPTGFDKHPDHIAVDSAVGRALQKLPHIQAWRLDPNGEGEVRLAVDRQFKLRATTAHLSQFMGLRLFGRVFLSKLTKHYLARYANLVQDGETYNIGYDREDSADAYRSRQSTV